jgi:hypothetical protein
LWETHKICGKELSERGASLASLDYIAVYLIQDVCFDTASHLDAIAPVTVNVHEKIEQTLVEPLKEAISSLDASSACDEKISILAKLLKAYREAIKIS